MTRFRARLKKLEAGRAAPGECDGGTTVLLFDEGDGPRHRDGTPYDPSTALRCPKCGRPHVMIVHEMIVLSRDGPSLTPIEYRAREAAGTLPEL